MSSGAARRILLPVRGNPIGKRIKAVTVQAKLEQFTEGETRKDQFL